MRRKMNIKTLIIGAFLVILGIGGFTVYEYKIKPEIEAGKLYREAVIVAQRCDRTSYNKAIDMHVKIMAQYPKSSYSFKSYLSISELYEKIGLYRLAYINYNYLIKTYPKRVDSAGLRHDIISRIAVLKLRQNRTDEGLNQLYSILNETSEKELRARIYSEIGYDSLKKSNMNKSLDSFNLALGENSENEEAVLGKARTLIRLGKYEEAFELYDVFLKFKGEFSPYAQDVRKAYLSQLYDCSLSYFRSGKYSSSVAASRRLLANFPQSKLSENSYYWAGEGYYALGNYKNAVAFFTKALSNSYYHKDEDSLIKRGHSYFSMKSYLSAVKDYDRYMEQYRNGKYFSIASKWKEQALAEISQKEHAEKLGSDSYENKPDAPKDEKMSYDSGVDYDEAESENNYSSETFEDVTEL